MLWIAVNFSPTVLQPPSRIQLTRINHERPRDKENPIVGHLLQVGPL